VKKYCRLQFCWFVCQVTSARRQRSMGFGSGRGGGRAHLDFHTWYRYCR